MHRLWQTSDDIFPGYPSDLRKVSADSPSVVAVSLDDSELLLLDWETGERLLTFQGISSPIVTIQISADSKVLVAGVENGSVHVWNVETGAAMRRFSVGSGGYARAFGQELVVAVSPDSRHVVATAGGQTHVWDLESGGEVYRFEHEHWGWFGFAVPQFTDDGRLLLAAVSPVPFLWDLGAGRVVEHDLPPGIAGILSPDGSLYAQGLVGNVEEDVVLWDVASGRELQRLSSHTDGARPVAFAKGGHQLITWGWEGTARVWDVATGQELLVLAGHTDAIEDATLSPDERYLVTTGQDATVRVWDLEALLGRDDRVDGAYRLLQLSPDGRVALTIDPETGAAVLLNADSFEVLHHLGIKPEHLLDGSKARPPFSADGQMVVGVNESAKILVYDVASGMLIAEHANPDGEYKHPTFVPGSQHIFASGNRGAYLLDAHSGEQLHVFDVPNVYLGNRYADLVAVSGDGRYGVMHAQTEDFLHLVYLWDLETGTSKFQSAPLPTDWIVAFAFSDDTRYFAWGGTENIATVMDLHNGEEVIRLSHLDSVHAIDFSSDNRLLVTSTGGDGVVLWNLESGEIVRRFFAGSGQAGFVQFVDHDTAVLYSTFEDGLIHRQPVSIDGLIESMCARLQRDLTEAERRTYGLDHSPTCPKFAGP